MPVTALVDECPAYDLEPAEPADAAVPGAAGDADRRTTRARSLLGAARRPPTSPRARWAFEQYDCVVGSRTVRRPEQADAAVLLLPETP